MPRCREFNVDDALDQALQAFWLKGYAATSLSDLLAAMQLSKSSFYECFGSKRAVLLAALDRYSRRELAETRRHFAAGRALPDALADWLGHALLPDACRPAERCGCLILNLAIELAAHDAEIEGAVRRHLDALADCLADALYRGIDAGTLPAQTAVRTAADALLNLLAGVQVLAKGGVEPQRLQAVIDQHLQTLFLPG